MDRIDIVIDVPAVTPADLALPPAQEGTKHVAKRVKHAREIAEHRNGGVANAELGSAQLEHIAEPVRNAQELLQSAAQTLGLTARGYHRILRVARTLADLDGCETIQRLHVAEALSHRRSGTSSPGQRQQAKSRQSWPK